MSALNEYMRANRKNDGGLSMVARIECNDGFSISVQGHYGAYCAPRVNGAGHYTLVECGFPSGPVPSLREYKDGGDETDDTSTVYGYVPIEVVETLLAEHGGIKGPAEVDRG